MSKRYYETTFIVDSILEDDKVDAIVSRYMNFFEKSGGEVVKTEKWGRRKLTYPIKKRTTGSYISIEFNAEPSIIAKLERAYHLDDEVLRFSTISFDKKSLETRNSYHERRAAEEKARAEARLEQLKLEEEKTLQIQPETSSPETAIETNDAAVPSADAEAQVSEKSE